jgi:hypothetical protein
MTPEEIMMHGEAADRFLKDKTIQKIFSDMEFTYFTQWKAATDPAVREVSWAQARALGDLKRVLERTVVSGQHEAYLADTAKREAETGPQT